MITYRINGAIWHSEEDSFTEGCLTDTTQTAFSEINIVESTIDSLLSELYRQTNSKKEDCEYNACEETGRIDICWNSSKPFSFYRMSDKTKAKWKLGESKSYYNDFSVIVEKIEPVDFN